jgi:trehalose transport system substrate-binding protein
MSRWPRAVLGWLLVVGALATACRRDETAPPRTATHAPRALTFSISLAENEKDAVRELLRRLEARTGTRVTLVSIAAADLPERLKVDVRAGSPTIDLFAQDNLGLRVFVDERLVEDLSGVEIPAEVSPTMRPERFDGRQYFLPFRPNVQVTYANRARFRQAGVDPPTTVEDLRAVARQLKVVGRGIPRITLSLAQGAPAAVTISEWVVAFGGDPLVLNGDASVRAFEFLQALWQEGLLARESLLAQYDTQVDFLQGETAWLAPNWPFTSGVFADQDLLERFHVYVGWRGPARAAHVIGGDVLGIPRGVGAPRKERALALAGFLMSREAQQFLVERNAWPSIRTDAYSRVGEPQRETFEAVRKALENGWYRPNVAYWSDLSEAMNEAVRRVIVGGEPVRPVLDALSARVAAAARRKGDRARPVSARHGSG